jgi:hypothetical protein
MADCSLLILNLRSRKGSLITNHAIIAQELQAVVLLIIHGGSKQLMQVHGGVNNLHSEG